MTNLSLFELSAHYQKLMEVIANSDDLSDEEFVCVMKEFNDTNDSLETKVLNYTSIIKSFESQADSIKKAMLDMEKRAHSFDKQAERLRNAIKSEMEACNLNKAENEYHAVSIRINPEKVDENIDENILPSTYFKEKMLRSIDKISIKNDIKAGIDVPGARLVRETRLQIR